MIAVSYTHLDVYKRQAQDFADFMAKHGDFFPDGPKNLDELVDQLAQRSAAAQRMLNSMTQEQRRELMELSAQAFGSPCLLYTSRSNGPRRIRRSAIS